MPCEGRSSAFLKKNCSRHPRLSGYQATQITMRYSEQVMLHQMVQQIALDRKAYDALADSADTRLWLTDKTPGKV